MQKAFDLVKNLNGKWYHNYGVAFCPAHDNTKTPSLSISESPDGKLLLTCFAGCTFEAVTRACRSRGLMESQRLSRNSFIAENIKNTNTSWIAKKVWTQSKDIQDTIAARYLSKRGITAQLPNSLRFTENCKHTSGVWAPAMIARVDDASEFSIHRTYLDDNAFKSSLEPAKAMLGKTKGGHVKLTEFPTQKLLVCEGIETGLSLASGLMADTPTIWACLSTVGIQNVKLPMEPSELIIATDGDKAGLLAGNLLAARAHASGWSVSLLNAPAGQDFNDVLTGKSDGDAN